ncbi:hypothetical protein CN504_13215 [Bacillus anthracis]|nr:hypothetical protein CN504_13215 [Bacillus anthracis]
MIPPFCYSKECMFLKKLGALSHKINISRGACLKKAN